MSDRFEKLVGLAIAAGGIYMLSKYLKKCAESDWCDDAENDCIKSNTAKAREAAKRTYIAIKEIKNDAADFVGNIVKPEEAENKDKE